MKVQVSSAEPYGNVAWTNVDIFCSFQFSYPVLRNPGSWELWFRTELGTWEQENQTSFRRGEIGLWICWYLRYQEKRDGDGRSSDWICWYLRYKEKRDGDCRSSNKSPTAGKNMRKSIPMLKLVGPFPSPPSFIASPFLSCLAGFLSQPSHSGETRRKIFLLTFSRSVKA